MLKLLTMGKRLKQPYLQMLADMYARDRLKNRILRVEDWVRTNRHLRQIGEWKNGKQILQEIDEAIRKWYKVICPILMLVSTMRIDHSLEMACQCILQAAEFVHNLVRRNEGVAPFQLDFCIIYPNVVPADESMMGSSDEDDEDDGYSEEDEQRYFDLIGDMKSRFKATKCAYAASVIQNKQNTTRSPRSKRRFNYSANLEKRFERFKRDKISKKYQDHKYEEYPKFKRFLCAIDWRRDDGTENDRCYFWEPVECAISVLLNYKVYRWIVDVAFELQFDAGDGSEPEMAAFMALQCVGDMFDTESRLLRGDEGSFIGTEGSAYGGTG